MPKQKITPEQKHKFEEERARQILIYTFPEKYSTAELSESPDIIVPERSIGVEVTDSTIQAVHEKQSYVSGITTGRIRPDDERYKKFNTSEITKFTLPSGQPFAVLCMWGDSHDPLSAYWKKERKLNQPHYTSFNENNLFITAWMMDDEDLDNGLSKMIAYIRNENTERDRK